MTDIEQESDLSNLNKDQLEREGRNLRRKLEFWERNGDSENVAKIKKELKQVQTAKEKRA